MWLVMSMSDPLLLKNWLRYLQFDVAPKKCDREQVAKLSMMCGLWILYWGMEEKEFPFPSWKQLGENINNVHESLAVVGWGNTEEATWKSSCWGSAGLHWLFWGWEILRYWRSECCQWVMVWVQVMVSKESHLLGSAGVPLAAALVSGNGVFWWISSGTAVGCMF